MQSYAREERVQRRGMSGVFRNRPYGVDSATPEFEAYHDFVEVIRSPLDFVGLN